MTGEEAKRKSIDLAAIREKLASGNSPEVWRSLAELAETEEFVSSLQHEFPRQTSWSSSLSRREFLKLLAAPLALAGLSACVPQPAELIVPYVEAPEDLVPGKPLFFATAMELDGYARGLLVENRMGRPVKVEGNPEHPLTLGATDAFAQASLLSLYDPQRAQVITRNGRISTREAFRAELDEALLLQRSRGGAGLRLLTGTVTSPTLAAQLRALLELYPQARWHQYDPVGRDHVRTGARLAFGEIVETQYRFDAAEIILSLDDNFFVREPGNLRYVREFTSRRFVTPEQTAMNRLYVVESNMTITGAAADHRLRLQAGQVEAFALALAARLGLVLPAAGPPPNVPDGWLEALAEDLLANPGASLVLAGPQQSPQVHALAHAMNAVLQNIGQTVFYTDPVEANPVDQTESLRELVAALDVGQVDLLLILSENPAYASPADLRFAEATSNAALSVYSGLYYDETAARSDWHIPGTHYLETWSDMRTYDGTASIVQPLIYPLYNGLSNHELVALLLGQTDTTGYDIVRAFWNQQFTAANPGANDAEFDLFWRVALRNGVIPNTEVSVREVSLRDDFLADIASTSPETENEAALEIIFEPDPSVWDGRFFYNGWLQELPKPVTKLTWDNAAMISPETALRYELENEQVVELHFLGRSVRAPIWIQPGLPDDSVVVQLGYGERILNGEVISQGFNAYALRPSEHPWFAYGLEIRKTGLHYALATTQEHHNLEGRNLVRVATLEEFIANPDFAHEEEFLVDLPGHQPGGDGGEGASEVESEVVPEPPSIYPEFEYDGNQWGMAINLNTCIGCNACVVACQAENNVPVVGKDQVLQGREMHWLRIDSYYLGGLEEPQIEFEPVLCMHCEKAPCEPVCPVAATVHSPEGLNEQVYSRCIGTRYCSHNCPYKVRRFNFFQYAEEDVIPLKLMRNPEVSVRTRGVMEKCTYCIQRIAAARTEARKQNEPIGTDEVVTACQQACPSQAIIFGDINNPESQVRALKELPINYGLLEELGTQPRTTYLAIVRNPNPTIEA